MTAEFLKRVARGEGEETAELVGLAQAGDAEAFAHVYRRLSPNVVRYLHGVVGQIDAEDVAHEAFLAAYEALAEYEPAIAPFEAWLMRIARNRALDWRRRAARIGFTSLDELTVADPMHAESDDELADERVSRAALRGQLSRLPMAQRQVILLLYFLDCTVAQCARILGRTPATVRQHHHLAIRFLRQGLDPDYEEASTRTTLPMRALAMPRAFATGGFTLLPAGLGRALWL